MATETRILPCGAAVQRYSIIGTTTTVYRAHRPAPGYMGPYHTLCTIDDKLFGDVSTHEPPPDVDAIPPGPARVAAVHGWYDSQYQEAYRLIFEAFPEAKYPPVAGGYRQSDGTVYSWTN
jgi:hypothetical protein